MWEGSILLIGSIPRATSKRLIIANTPKPSSNRMVKVASFLISVLHTRATDIVYSLITESQPASKPPPPESPSVQSSTDTSLSPLGPRVDPHDDDAMSIDLTLNPITEKLTIGDEISYFFKKDREYQRAWILAINPALDAPLRLSTSELLYKNDHVHLIQPCQVLGSNRRKLTKMFRIEQYKTEKEGDMNAATKHSLEFLKKKIDWAQTIKNE